MPFEFTGSVLYTIQSGDTLSSIAEAHECTVEQLIAANAGLIDDPNLIQAGWDLVIPGQLTGNRRGAAPSGAGITAYTVREGDSLAALAERWGTSVSALVELNGIANPSLIFVGQRLRRPGEEIASEVPAIDATVGGSEVAVVAAGTTEVLTRTDRLVFGRWPVDMPPAIVTGGYRQDYGGYLHRGIDLGGMSVGTPIFAPAGGTLAVHRPGDGWGDGSFGICVVIDHPGTPWWSIYAHMSETLRVTGETVGAGDAIGRIGFTGRVEPAGPAGAHLHWQLSAHSGFPPGFEYIANPLDFLAA